MRKGKEGEFEAFRKIFDRVNAKTGKKQYMVPYFISNFPGCTREQMQVVDDYLAKSKWNVQQVQDFIPLPMTMGCAMYCAEILPDGTPIEVNKGLAERRAQREMLLRQHGSAYSITEAKNNKPFKIFANFRSGGSSGFSGRHFPRK